MRTWGRMCLAPEQRNHEGDCRHEEEQRLAPVAQLEQKHCLRLLCVRRDDDVQDIKRGQNCSRSHGDRPGPARALTHHVPPLPPLMPIAVRKLQPSARSALSLDSRRR
jgi:hypothetical protein